ncbi:hypothetical protein RFI_07497 [Reticulomyxa filosa]|uniref:Uncharacterized protein n=1 Tax=Reticulomyxa filosa TaxID=46433 RepID=X6NWG7_RETFI|nr:hypothetical protein RFI_07497 [Reticulomyxa filosa]|eukprot:ETO29622.1 hypothetical protein RFI_07497 [Reticulomyxa filosa]
MYVYVFVKERDGILSLSPPPSTTTTTTTTPMLFFSANFLGETPMSTPLKREASDQQFDEIKFETRATGITKIFSKHLRFRKIEDAVDLLQNPCLQEVKKIYIPSNFAFEICRSTEAQQYIKAQFVRTFGSARVEKQLFEDRLIQIINNPPNPNLYINLDLLTKRQRTITPNTLIPFHQLSALPQLLETLRNNLISANGNILSVFNAHKMFLYGILSLHGVFDRSAKMPSPPHSPSLDSCSDSPPHAHPDNDISQPRTRYFLKKGGRDKSKKSIKISLGGTATEELTLDLDEDTIVTKTVTKDETEQSKVAITKKTTASAQ